MLLKVRYPLGQSVRRN